MEELSVLAQKIQSYEQSAAQAASPWYDLETDDTSALDQIQGLCESSLDTLQKLHNLLNNRLQAARAQSDQSVLQHAYHLVQELSQSREAVLEMAKQIKGGDAHPEFLRAIALKERAAATQCQMLSDVVQQIH